MFSQFSRKDRLYAAIGVSVFIFVMEMLVGFHTVSMALMADAFHSLSDILGFAVTLGVERLSESHSKEIPSFWKLSPLFASFFSGFLLVGLGVTVILCAISLFITRLKMQTPILVLAVGCASLALNLLSALCFYVHDKTEDMESGAESQIKHSHETFPMHVMADVICGLGVIIAAVVNMQVKGEGRYYADPGASIVIGLVVVTFAARLAKTNWNLLHQKQEARSFSGDGDFELKDHANQGSENEDSIRKMGLEGDGEGEEEANGNSLDDGEEDEFNVGDGNAEEEAGNDWGGENQDRGEEPPSSFETDENSEDVANPETEGEQEPENEGSWENGEPEETGDPGMESENVSNDQNEFGKADGNLGDAETGEYTGGEEATPDDENAPNEDAGGNDDTSTETAPPTEDDTITGSGVDGVVKQIVQAGKKAKKALLDGTNYIEKQFENSWNGDDGEQTGLKNDNYWDGKDDTSTGGEDSGPKVKEGGWV